jgi:hypothetical protein
MCRGRQPGRAARSFLGAPLIVRTKTFTPKPRLQIDYCQQRVVTRNQRHNETFLAGGAIAAAAQPGSHGSSVHGTG